jgi:hypothetical protein
LHSGLLQLLIRPARFDGLVLPLISHQYHAVLMVQSMEEIIHLLRAG